MHSGSSTDYADYSDTALFKAFSGSTAKEAEQARLIKSQMTNGILVYRIKVAGG